jgi:hypothetical protein
MKKPEHRFHVLVVLDAFSYFSQNTVIYFKSSCWVQASLWVERALYDEAPDPGPHRGGCRTHHQAAALRLKQVREREDLQKKVSDQFPSSYIGQKRQAPVI